jgi:hypothetical protein
MGLLLVVCGGMVPSASSGQEMAPGSIQGRIRGEDGTPAPGVLVLIYRVGSEAVTGGAESDDLGFYHVEPLSPGFYLMVVSRLGLETETRETEVAEGQRVTADFALRTAPLQLEGISVEAERSRERVRFENEAGLTLQELAGSVIKGIPGLVEADPLRAVEVLPGVTTVSDFSSAFNVRGGSADQNLILLDGIPVFNPTHLGGFFSVFNADMIQRAELRSGGFPARYGGRVSSVLDIQTDAGGGEFGGEAGISLLATRLALGGNMPDGFRDGVGLRRGRWRISGRRSYFDQILKGVMDFPYHLTDLQGFFEGWTQGGDRISVSAYSGRDVLDLTALDPDDFPLRIDWDWGNTLIGARWTRPREDGGWWEIRSGFSRFTSGLKFPDFADTDIRTAIDQQALEWDLELRPTPYLSVGAGMGIRRLTYDNLFATGGTELGAGDGKGSEFSGYLQTDWTPSSSWILEMGARLDRWVPSGGGGFFELSPRVSVKRFLRATQWALKASAGRYSQYLHSIRDEELPLGLDVWILTGDQIPHVVSDQVQFGFEGYPREGWFFSAEAYYRAFDGVVTTNFADNPNDVGDDFLPGTGISWGGDLFLRYTGNETSGWLALSFLRANRTFPDFLSGLDPSPDLTYPPIFDRRVDVDLVLQHEIRGGLQAGLRWNFGTGLPYTRPLGSYRYLSQRIIPGSGLQWDPDAGGAGGQGVYGVVLSRRNGARYPARHRLDLSLRWTLERGWGRLVPYLSVLNVYNRKNVLFYFFEYDQTPPVRTGISMFPFLPTLGLEVSF